MSGKKHKKPVLGAKVKPQKRPKRAVVGKPTTDDPTVIWGFSYVDLGGQWGWSKIDPKVLAHVLKFLHNLEALRPNEVFGRKHKRIELPSLCPEAQKRLTQMSMIIQKCRSMVTEKCRSASSSNAAALAPA